MGDKIDISLKSIESSLKSIESSLVVSIVLSTHDERNKNQIKK